MLAVHVVNGTGSVALGIRGTMDSVFSLQTRKKERNALWRLSLPRNRDSRSFFPAFLVSLDVVGALRRLVVQG